MSLSNDLRLTIRSTQTQNTGMASVTCSISKSVVEPLAGADACYSADLALSTADDDFDLVGGLEDAAGNVVSFSKVKALYFYNKSDTAMQLGGANNVPFFADPTDKLVIPAGARVMLLNPTGFTVTAGTGDLITVAGTAGKTFELCVIGDSNS